MSSEKPTPERIVVDFPKPKSRMQGAFFVRQRHGLRLRRDWRSIRPFIHISRAHTHSWPVALFAAPPTNTHHWLTAPDPMWSCQSFAP